jgi:prepilin-type N-terminal cleavage/methylation domain-containing protein
MNPFTRAIPLRGSPARGFTLLETILATVIGALVLAGAVSLFTALSRSERTMSRASQHLEDLALTQQVLRRSCMTMVLAGRQSVQAAIEQAEQDGEITPEEQANLPRPRFLLEFDGAPSLGAMRSNAALDGATLYDPAGYGLGPQRLELVLPDKPVPESMRLFPAAWVRAPTDDLLRAFDPSGVQRPSTELGLRGCFELRPDGARERVMEGLGLVPATGLRPRPRTPAARVPPEGWTLWWRPVYGEEYWARQRGEAFDIDLRPILLAEAVPLVRGIRRLRWTAFAAEPDPDDPQAPAIVERWPRYDATTVEEIPGYVELEIETTTGTYANWMFEMGWSLADETSDQQTEQTEQNETPEPTEPTGGET